MTKLRIACCGGWHSHAKDFPMDRAPKMCAGLPWCFPVVWDDDPVRGQTWAREMNSRFEPDFHAVCADPDIDAVIITCGATKHAALAVEAARAGKHIFLEKPLATDPEEARAIRDAVLKSGVHFTISDPVERPQLVFAKRLMDSGALGNVTEVRYRSSHGLALSDPEGMRWCYDRSQSGGGALWDMGHHAVHVLYWFLGKPTNAIGVFSRFSALGKAENVDDVGMAAFLFPSGAVGIAETGWFSPVGASILEIHGTKGFLQWIQGEPVRVRAVDSDGWTDVPSDQLPPPAVYPLRYWMESILNDTPNTLYGVEEAVEVCEMIAAAYESQPASL